MGIFQCQVSFQGGTWYLIVVGVIPISLLFFDIIFGFTRAEVKVSGIWCWHAPLLVWVWQADPKDKTNKKTYLQNAGGCGSWVRSSWSFFFCSNCLGFPCKEPSLKH